MGKRTKGEDLDAIPLEGGTQFVLVPARDYDWLKQYAWFAYTTPDSQVHAARYDDQGRLILIEEMFTD